MLPGSHGVGIRVQDDVLRFDARVQSTELRRDCLRHASMCEVCEVCEVTASGAPSPDDPLCRAAPGPEERESVVLDSATLGAPLSAMQQFEPCR